MLDLTKKGIGDKDEQNNIKNKGPRQDSKYII